MAIDSNIIQTLINSIEKHLTVCPVCGNGISLSVQESQVRDNADAPWRPFHTYSFECIVKRSNSVPDSNIRLSDFEFTIYNNPRDCYLTWTTKTGQRIGFSSSADFTQKKALKDIWDNCLKLSGQILADYIKKKVKTLLIFD